MLIVAIEGDNPAGPAGMTLAETAALMRGLGCVAAINLDGGGSTSMVVGGRTTVRPGDGAERPVVAALVLLLGVFSLYLQPNFLFTLAQQVWSCF